MSILNFYKYKIQ